MNQYPYGYMNTPGQYEGEVFVDKQITYFSGGEKHKVPITLASLTGDLDAGTVLGLSTDDGLYRPVRRTTLTANAASGDTALSVGDAYTLFKPGDKVSVMKADGSGLQDAGTVQSIDTIAKKITVTTALTAAVNSGGFVFVSDGSEVARVILAQPIPDAPSPKVATVYVGGTFYTDQLVGLDAIALKDLSARQPIPNMTIVPV
ncbi:hypothetical protein P4T20_14960 [Aneurinibacillus thermoaerophilus]|uniref:hypothetical protein n=1 Tax=Aneurinibacillus thermoaerophilus TaxID=143495 RepID=UPI002E1DF4B3|nr:hypothetical protein [Aneurinibacillus thermoaerophilus]